MLKKFCLFLIMTFIAPQTLKSEQKIQEVNHTHTMYPVSTPLQSGYLKVSDIHSLYYATYGNPQGTPIVVLHGGPGAGCGDGMSRFFDSERWYIIMFDQRGAPRSIPVASMEDNTTQDLVSDIELLREHLGINKWAVFGGSWGSTLALVYGEAYPDRCLGFVLRGIFLGRGHDYKHLFYGMGKVFPEAYQIFLDAIPEEEHGDLLSAYYQRIMDPNPDIHMPVARAFTEYDMICARHLPDPKAIQKIVNDDTKALCLIRAFTYYSYNKFFLEPNQVLSNLNKINHLPAIIVHGRWDAICFPDSAYTLNKNWANSELWFVVDGGHSSEEKEIGASLATATDKIFQMLAK